MRFWRHVVKPPDCQELVTGSREQSPWMEVKHFRRTESSFRDDVDDNAERASAALPDDEWVSDFWRHRAIDAVSVHIEGKSACIVAVPVAAQQLSECMEDSIPETGRTRYELTWLARLLARRTSSSLKKQRCLGRTGESMAWRVERRRRLAQVRPLRLRWRTCLRTCMS